MKLATLTLMGLCALFLSPGTLSAAYTDQTFEQTKDYFTANSLDDAYEKIHKIAKSQGKKIYVGNLTLKGEFYGKYNDPTANVDEIRKVALKEIRDKNSPYRIELFSTSGNYEGAIVVLINGEPINKEAFLKAFQ